VGLLTRRISNFAAQFITSGALVVSAMLSGIVFYKVAHLGVPVEMELGRWIDIGAFHVNWMLRADSLTCVMLLVVTVVSSVVHIYSCGYMSHDEHVPRFMAYLSLFTFFMLMLVTSGNFIQLFLGWEGVGLCSYLLIGFWFNKQSACNAAMKAFIVNRVGDFGLILGIFSIYMVFGNLGFAEVFALAPDKIDATINLLGHEFNAVNLICVLLFIGAMGKSAQLGLHTWLPDAMEGPTPVSALIHAATMVTAGVFLVARCSPLFEHAEIARQLVIIVGGFTAIFAATIAITQNDIKRVIAYSTCSQLGYMFFACGVSAYSAGVFHLMTHGFFKALLFLGAGSVIHAMSGEQDLRNMGGIWKKIPVTYAMMWIGSFALAGIFPFAGYYSKDFILEAAYAAGGFGRFAFWIGVVTVVLTAFYSWRLMIMAFHGKPRASEEVMNHVHESPFVMILPLLLLAVGAVFSGYVGEEILGMVEYSGHFWRGSIVVLDKNNFLEAAHNIPEFMKLLPSLVDILGIFMAYVFYMFVPSLPGTIASNFSPVYNFLLNKWYFDELYELIFVRPAQAIGRFFWRFGDVVVIDGGGPNGAAWLAQRFAGGLSLVQSGFLYNYALVMLLGMIALIGWFLV